MGARVVSVNIGPVVHAGWAGRPRQTAIDKRPVDGPVKVRKLGLAGDAVGDPRFHGGVHKAVYAYAAEDLRLWEDRLGRPVRPGLFGENLTTVGVDLSETVLGEHWRVGTALLSPSEIRTPCNTFRKWLGREGFDTTGWLRRFIEEGRAGTYLRVLEEGVVRAGDEVVVDHRPEHGVRVSTMFTAFTQDATLLPRLLAVEGLPDEVYAAARKQRYRTHR